MTTDRNTADPVIDLDSELVALDAEQKALNEKHWLDLGDGVAESLHDARFYERANQIFDRKEDAMRRFADMPSTSFEGVIAKLCRVARLLSSPQPFRNNFEQELGILLLAIADIERLTAESSS